MPWTKFDKAKIDKGYGIRDGSSTYACPICWGINRGYENNYRLTYKEPSCPICKVELEWTENE